MASSLHARTSHPLATANRAEGHAHLSWIIQRILLAIVILEIPFQFDVYLNYDYALAELGAIGGLNVSVTTFCLIGLYAFLLPRLAREKTPTLRSMAPLLFLAATYLMTIGLSFFAASNLKLAFNEFWLVGQAFLVLTYVAMSTRTRDDVTFILTVMLAGLLLQSVVMIGIWALGHGVKIGPLHLRVDESGRVGGTIGSPNGAGSYLALLLPLAVTLFGQQTPWKLRLVSGVTSVTTMLALILTYSRGAWGAAIVAVFILGSVSLIRGQLKLQAVLPLVGVFLVVCGIFHRQIAERIWGSDGGAAWSRVPLMQIATNIIADRPVLGVGANNYAVASRPYATAADFRGEWDYAVHNQYLRVWAETGTIGVAAFLAFLGCLAILAWKLASQGKSLLSFTALAFLAGILGHAAHMMLDSMTGRPHVQLLWFIAGLLIAIDRILDTEAPAGPPPQRYRLGPIANTKLLVPTPRTQE